MQRSGVSILLIEDDFAVAEAIVGNFSVCGYSVKQVADGIEGLALARSGDFHLAIIDRTLPGLDGLSIIEQLRRDQIGIPALVLSSLGEVEDRVRGLTAGGDDYLPKPFHLFELAARVEALLRRGAVAQDTLLRLGPLTLDLIERTASRGERAIELLPREFKLLDYLMRRPGQVVTRAMLLEDVWKYNFIAETNVIDVHVSKLRRKIDGDDEMRMLHSIRGAGFMLCIPK